MSAKASLGTIEFRSMDTPIIEQRYIFGSQEGVPCNKRGKKGLGLLT